MDSSKLKEIIKSRMMKKSESPREREIRERNEQSHIQGLKMSARMRHERRHKGAKGTTLSERSEWMKQMSKDS